MRYLVGDTNGSDQIAQDEEIKFALALEADIWLAGALVAEVAARNYARQASLIKVGDTSVDYATRADRYATMAVTLRMQSGIRTSMPYAGGIDVGDKRAQEQDTSTVRPGLTRRLFDFPGLGIPSSVNNDETGL